MYIRRDCADYSISAPRLLCSAHRRLMLKVVALPSALMLLCFRRDEMVSTGGYSAMQNTPAQSGDGLLIPDLLVWWTAFTVPSILLRFSFLIISLFQPFFHESCRKASAPRTSIHQDLGNALASSRSIRPSTTR